MAKSSALQLVNKVLNNLGEPDKSVLTSLAGLSLLVFNTINEAIYDLASENKYKPLEATGSMTLGAGTSTYAKASDVQDFDEKSFKYDNQKPITYITPQKFDRNYPIQTDTGIPSIVTEWEDFFWPYLIPDANAAGKLIKYRYWKIPTILSTDTPAGTCWIPEGFDLTMLADLVTYKILHYKNNQEAANYYSKVYGNRSQNLEGSLNKFKVLYGSPELLDDNIVVEQMENNGGGGIFTQNPILS